MTPASPVLLNGPGPWRETTFGADQPQYRPLPALKSREGIVTTRWRMSWSERLRALVYGSIWLQVHTYNQPLQPVIVRADEPDWNECI